MGQLRKKKVNNRKMAFLRESKRNNPVVVEVVVVEISWLRRMEA